LAKSKLLVKRKSPENDFLTLKKKGIDIENLPKPEFKISKRSLKKVKLDGHYGGRNRIIFDSKGEKTSSAMILR